MRKCIISTTVHPPTEALLKFKEMKDWHLIVIGDLKTPHEAYKSWNYISPNEQSEKYPELSRMIGWNCIQRRSIGFIEAFKWGADVVATVDDDNIPYDNWGQLLLGWEPTVDYYEVETAFDPLSVTNYNHLWHRGYPLELLKTKNRVEYQGKRKIKPLIQADLWDGDPDIDAICRITHSPNVKFNISSPYCSNKISPFNSQNTFISREVLPYYFMYPHIGRMDDIWASYFVQSKFPNSVVYNEATVFQKRNPHNLLKDMESEKLGYDLNLEIVKNPESLLSFLPKQSVEAFKEYTKCFEK